VQQLLLAAQEAARRNALLLARLTTETAHQRLKEAATGRDKPLG
jgi:hypothetical protein